MFIQTRLTNTLLFLLVVISILLVTGCRDKVKKETRWDVYQEPVEAKKLPADSGLKELTELWSRSVGGAGEAAFAILKPIYFNGAVFTASRNGTVSKFNAVSGEIIWKINTGSSIYAGVGANEGIAAVVHDNGDLVAVNTTDGGVLWTAKLKRQISAIPVIGKGRVIVRTADGLIIGLDSTSGETKWEVKKSVPGFSIHGDSTPTVTGDAVLVGLSNGRLIANNVINGRDYWETEISFVRGKNEVERLSDADTPPMVVGTTVFAGTYQGSIVALRLQNAELIWRKSLSTRLPLAIFNRLLVVTEELGSIVALDAASGDLLWQQDAFMGHGVSNPLIIGERIIIGDRNGRVHTLEATSGALIETRKVVSGAIVGMIQNDRQFTVLSSEGDISTLSL